MMVAFRALEQRDWPYVVDRLEMAWAEGTTGVVAFDVATGDICGVMVCQAWTKNSCESHIVIENKAALKHGFHNECANYVFTQAGREKMIGIIPSNNEKALRLDRKFGFTDVGVIKDGFEQGVDIVIMELHRDNCPYWDQKQVEAA